MRAFIRPLDWARSGDLDEPSQEALLALEWQMRQAVLGGNDRLLMRINAQPAFEDASGSLLPFPSPETRASGGDGLSLWGQVPEQIWTAPDGVARWDLEAITTFCLDEQQWRDPQRVATQPAERLLLMFHGYVYCALHSDAADHTRRALEQWASGYGLQVIAGSPEHAWPG